MHVPHKLILKAYLACCSEGTKKSLENILILQNKTEAKNKPLSITTPTQLKKKLYIYNFMSNRHSFLVTSVNIAGVVFRKGDDN
jgi:hypothetical protein